MLFYDILCQLIDEKFSKIIDSEDIFKKICAA